MKFLNSKQVMSWAVLAGLLCGGCLSKPALNRETFAFLTPPPPGKTPGDGPVVAIRSVTVSPLFGGQSFVYRIGPMAYETDPYAGFLVMPVQAVEVAVREHLLASGRFRDVVLNNGESKPDKVINVHISELYADFTRAQTNQPPAAVLSLRVSVFDADDAVALSSAPENYTRLVPLRRNRAADVMAGWDTALRNIMAEVAVDVAGKPPVREPEMHPGGQEAEGRLGKTGQETKP